MITVDPNKVCYIFDVDGTLTEPRQKMDSNFANEFILWSLSKQCYVATGSFVSGISPLDSMIVRNSVSITRKLKNNK